MTKINSLTWYDLINKLKSIDGVLKWTEIA